MTRDEIEYEVRSAVKEVVGYKPSDEFLFTSMKLDSLDVVKLIMTVEELYDIEVADKEVAGLQCIKDVVDLVERKIGNERADSKSIVSP